MRPFCGALAEQRPPLHASTSPVVIPTNFPCTRLIEVLARFGLLGLGLNGALIGV
jgi:hypothetical protein